MTINTCDGIYSKALWSLWLTSVLQLWGDQIPHQMVAGAQTAAEI
jgi:hypothetical protein